MAKSRARQTWLMPALFVIVTLLAMPGALLPNNSPVSEIFFPGFIALYLCIIFPRRRENFKTLGVHKLGKIGAYVPVILLLIASALSYVLPGLFGLSTAGPLGQLGHVIVFIPLAVFEEIGWRGYLQGQLTSRIGVRKAVVAVGIIWAIWHTGLLLSGQLLNGGNMATGTILFVASSILISIMLGFSRYTSGSVWPAVIGHAGLNYVEEFGNAIFSHQSGAFTYVSGVVSLLLLAGLAYYYWKKLPKGLPATAK
ncbi:MAG TPA: CPBP family intramembrane glutamic endopeptidase [Candidatus Saccharimonas sp.]|nr:CPBP family intramembrane glutamic endopeptidase [Candidatus Saccharimonas sp.]